MASFPELWIISDVPSEYIERSMAAITNQHEIKLVCPKS